jgi:HNH endonuclease
MADGIITRTRLKEFLHYDPETGVFTWLVKPCRNILAGSIAGNVMNEGYVMVKIDRKNYKAHRLAWLYVHGTFPPDQLDHINRGRADNRLCNLRLSTQA